MATKRRPFTNIADSVLREPWSSEEYVAITRLAIYLHERWRTDRLTFEEATHAVLSKADLHLVTMKGRSDVGLKLLRSCAEVASISIERRGDFIEIDWPNWAEYQGYSSHEDPRKGPSESASRVREKKKTTRVKPEPSSEVCNRAWIAGREAAHSHGIPWGGALETWIDRLRPRLRDHAERGDLALAEAVHGYVAFNGDRTDGWPWRKYCRPSTLLQKEKFATALETFDQVQAKERRREKLELETEQNEPTVEDLEGIPAPRRVG